MIYWMKKIYSSSTDCDTDDSDFEGLIKTKADLKWMQPIHKKCIKWHQLLKKKTLSA